MRRRSGRVPKTHKLAELYLPEFPPALGAALEARYAELMPRGGWVITRIGLRTSPTAPEPPDGAAADGPAYASFAETITGLTSVFTDSRYFYEQVGTSGWAVFDYAVEPGSCAAATLDTVFEER